MVKPVVCSISSFGSTLCVIDCMIMIFLLYLGVQVNAHPIGVGESSSSPDTGCMRARSLIHSLLNDLMVNVMTASSLWSLDFAIKVGQHEV